MKIRSSKILKVATYLLPFALTLPLLFVSFIEFTPQVFAQQGGVVPQNCSGPDCDFDDFMALIIRVVNFVVTLGIAFSAIVFAYAGWLYMSSGGDSGKVQKAHDMFIRVLWGFLFALGGYLIVRLIATSLGLSANIPLIF